MMEKVTVLNGRPVSVIGFTVRGQANMLRSQKEPD